MTDEDKQFETIRLRDQLHENEHGWACHLVDDGAEANYHTHRLLENYGHPDLQITLRIRPQCAYALFSAIAEWIKQGNKYEPGREYEGLLSDNQKVEFAKAMDYSMDQPREVLRIILPDASGATRPDSLEDPKYAAQWEGTYRFEFQRVAWENHWTEEYAKGYVDARGRSHGGLPPEGESLAREDDYGCGYLAGYRCHGRSLLEGLES